MRLLIRLALGLVLLVILAVVLLGLFLDRAARVAVERGGTYVLGTPTELEAASVGLTSGNFALTDLRVRNPEGFQEPYFVRMQGGLLAVSMGTLLAEEVQAQRLVLKGLELTLERSKQGSNYGKILDNIERLQPKGPQPEGQPSPEKAGGKRFVIREVLIQDLTAKVYLSGGLGAFAKTTVTIPEVRLENVGEQGQSVGEIIAVVTNAALQAVVHSGAGILPDDLLADLRTQLPELRFGKLQLDQGVKSTLEELGAKASEALKDVEKDLQGLLKGKPKK